MEPDTVVSKGESRKSRGLTPARNFTGSPLLFCIQIAMVSFNFFPRPMLAQEGAQEAQGGVQDFAHWAELCRSLAATAEYKKALEACDQAIALNANDAATWSDRGVVLLALAQYPEAVASYDQAVRLNPADAEAWTRRCEGLTQLDKPEDAIASCETALRIDQNWGTVSPAVAWYYRGSAFGHLAKPDEALFSYDWATQLNPDYSLAWAGRCSLLASLGREQEALTACNQALQRNGDWGNATPAIAWVNLARIQAQQQWYDAALVSYDRALAINPENAVVWTEHGTILGLLGQSSEALASHNWAIKLSPNYALALANQCATLTRLSQSQADPEKAQEQLGKALEACDKAIQEGDGRWGKEGPAYAWNQRGNALIGLGRYEEALASANRAIALNPDYADPWSNRAVALWHLGRHQDALTSTERAIAIDPRSSYAWFNNGRIQVTLGQYEDAVAAYEQALVGDANVGDRFTLAEIWINQSAVLWRLERYEAALTAADNAIGINPDSIKAWYNRGLALVALDRYQQAIQTYDRAIMLDAENANLWAGKGIALRLVGNLGEALTALEQALKLNPNHPQALFNRNLVLQELQPSNTVQAQP